MASDVGIAVVVPVLARPANASLIVDSFLSARSVESRLLFVCSPRDTAELEACRELERLHHHRVSTLVADWEPAFADFARKVNLGFRASVEPYVFQAADDVEFTPGWDAEALRVAEESGCGVVGTNDAANPSVRAGRHSTHSLIARWYVDKCGASLEGQGYVFSPSYGHQYADNELVELAQSRGCFAFAKESVVMHRHPYWGTAKTDATYHKGQSTAHHDREVFMERRRQWTKR